MLRRFAIFALTTTLTLAMAAPAALAGPGEGDMVALINADRVGAGLNPLTTNGTLTAHARSHSQAMLETDSVWHTKNLKAVTTGWSRIGENVGRGPTIPSIHYAFMSSSGHKKNVLGEYSHVGVGTAVSNTGVIYVTVVFMLQKGASTSSPATTTTTTTPPVPTTTSVPAAVGTTSTTPTKTSVTTLRAPARPAEPATHRPSAEELARRLPFMDVAGLKPCTS